MPNSDRPDGAATVVMFCATQRTGSSLIHDDLLNLMGHWSLNAEVLFSRIVRDATTQTWPELWVEICKKFTIGHVIPLKVMFHYTPSIARFMRGEPAIKKRQILEFSPADFDAFHAFFADAVWVAIRRRDPVQQVVSIYIAERTGRWQQMTNDRPDQPLPPADAAYDSNRLLTLLTNFLKERRQWDRFFAHYGITPVRLDYDDAVANYPGYMDGLLARLGVQPVQPPPPRRFVKVGGALNTEFAARLHAEAAHLFSPEDLL
jgi:LPS sulfotransferase NodH